MLEGAFEKMMEQFVRYGRDDPIWMRDLPINLVWKMRERSKLPKGHPN